MEVWKPVTCAISGGYEVSSLGNIRSFLHRGATGTMTMPEKPHPISTKPGKAKYTVVKLKTGPTTSRCFKVHCIVAETFLGPRPAGVSSKGRCSWDVDHINGDTRDNRACNLRYVTHRENVLSNPLHPANNPVRGMACRSAKLTEDNVREIRKLAAKGHSRRALGRQYGVSNVCITLIVNRRTWRHVT